jgi:hypothetical protein
MWQKMQCCCQQSKHAVTTSMTSMFKSDQVKGSFFLTMLLDMMDNIINNLSTCGIMTFSDIEPKMLDIAEKHAHQEPQSAYYTSISRQQDNPGKDKQNALKPN